MSDESNKTFRVKDRRMFTAEGDVRSADDAPAAATPTAEPAPAPEPPPPPTASEPEPEPEPDPAAPAEAESGEGPVDFSGFIASLATQAMQALMQQPPRLREARTLVSILEMLKDKTEGRRTAEESDLFDALLYQLRMGYIERQRAGGA